MATDYDAPRVSVEETEADSLEVLMTAKATTAASSAAIDVDEVEAAEGLELPGADLSHESLSVTVVPIQSDEFTCSKCFLVNHRTRLASNGKTGPVCIDCA